MKSKFIIYSLIFLAVCLTVSALAQEARTDKEFVFAEKLYDDGMHLLAAEQFEQIARRDFNNEKADDAWFLAGEAYFKASDFRNAFEAFKELEVGYPQSRHLPLARFRLGQTQLQMGNHVTAAELFKRVASYHHDNDYAPKSLLQAGLAYRQVEEWPAALDCFHELVSTYADAPERLEGHLEIVKTYIELEKYNEAIGQIDAILKIYGDDFNEPRIMLLRAQVFEELGQNEKAEAAYLKVTKNFPESAAAQQAFYHLGVLTQNKADFEAALDYFKNAVSGDPGPEKQREAYLRMGDICSSHLHDYQKALEYYQASKKLKQNKSDIECDYKIGLTLYHLEQYFLAEMRLRELISKTQEIDLSAAQAAYAEKSYQTLIEVQVALKHYRDALASSGAYKKRFAEGKLAPQIFFREAEIAEQNIGDYTRALRAYDEFIARFPQNPQVDEARYALGRCYEKLNEYQLALREYRNYIEQYPGGENFETVENRITLIQETINLNQEEGIQRLSALFGKYVRSDANTNWDLELARLYLEIKQFSNAISQLKKILKTSDQQAERTELLFDLGRSYYGLARKSRLQGNAKQAAAAFDSAAISLEFVKNQSESSHRHEAAYLHAKISLQDLASPEKARYLQQLERDWQQNYPDSPYFDFLLIKLARVNSDTGNVNTLELSQQHCDSLLQKFPDSRFRGEATFLKAFSRFHVRKDSSALQLLDRFTQEYPGSRFTPHAFLLLAQLEKQYGNFTRAVTILQKVKSEYFYSPYAPQAAMALGKIYLEQNEYQSAVEVFEAMPVAKSSFSGANGVANNGVIYFYRGKAYEGLKESERALQNYIHFLTNSGTSETRLDAIMAVADIAREQKNLDFAETYYRDIVQSPAKQKNKVKAHIALGDLLFEKEEFEQARKEYLAANALAEAPEQQRYVHRQAIRCLYKQKKIAEGDAEVENFKKRFDDTKMAEGQFLLDKGNAFVAQKKFELAEKAFKDLRGDFKKTELGAQGEFGLGKVYLITNHTEDALEILTEIPEKYPESEVTALTYLNLGDFYYKSGQVENAISAFKQVLKHPNSEKHQANALKYLIQCYRDVGFWDQAIATTRQFLDVYPYSEDSFRKKIDLAFFLMKLKEYDRAIRNFRELLALADAETEAEIQFYIAQCYNEMGNFKRATSEYLKVKYLTAPSKLPWHVTALFEAGRCLLRLDQMEHAKRIFQQIVREQGAQSNFGRFAQQKLDELADSSP